MPRGPRTPLRDPAAMTAGQLCNALERAKFECPGGPLKNTVEWIELRRRLGAPSRRWG